MIDYFELYMNDDNRMWSIAILESYPDGSPVDIWKFFQCKVIDDPRPIPFKIQVEGSRVDYNPTAFGAKVISRKMAETLEKISPRDFQRIPAMINGETGEWEVMNVLSCLDCIDKKASKIQYFPESHSKSGKPRSIFPLVIDPRLTGNHHIFHPKDWRVATIVSEFARNAMNEIGATGMRYMPVTGLQFHDV